MNITAFPNEDKRPSPLTALGIGGRATHIEFAQRKVRMITHTVANILMLWRSVLKFRRHPKGLFDVLTCMAFPYLGTKMWVLS